MVQAGEITIGAACEFSGLDRHEFMHFLKSKEIPLQTQTPSEIETEFID